MASTSAIILPATDSRRVVANYKQMYVNEEQGPELQCLLKVKEYLSLVLVYQDTKHKVSN